ncbi:MAG TPA: TIGR00725 family protein [Solirubrobacteraceae bacterium]
MAGTDSPRGEPGRDRAREEPDRHRPVYVAVVGASQPTAAQTDAAEAIGAELARAGATVINGGGSGVMAAVSRGAAQAGGTVVGILPGSDRAAANEWVGIALPTGLGELRNGLIVRAADVVLAVGGAYGTLSEVALALATGVPVVGYDSWSVAGVEVAADPQQAVALALERAAGDAV